MRTDTRADRDERSRSGLIRAEHRSAPGTPADALLLDVHQAAALLSLKPATLYQWAYQRRLPVVKLFGPRGALRFRRSDIDALIARSLRPAL